MKYNPFDLSTFAHLSYHKHFAQNNIYETISVSAGGVEFLNLKSIYPIPGHVSRTCFSKYKTTSTYPLVLFDLIGYPCVIKDRCLVCKSYVKSKLLAWLQIRFQRISNRSKFSPFSRKLASIK